MGASLRTEDLLERLHEDLYASSFHESELGPEDVEEILRIFCKHRRLLKILLTLCGDD